MRVALFVDGANYFYMQRDTLKWWVDAQKLIEYVKRYGDLVDAYYYVGLGLPQEVQQEAYINRLIGYGYSIVTKEIKKIMQEDGTFTQKANLDIEIVLDMFNTIDLYDMAILVSGDGDFERPLQQLRSRAKRFCVMSTEGIVANEIRRVAGMHFVDFQDIKEIVQRKYPIT